MRYHSLLPAFGGIEETTSSGTTVYVFLGIKVIAEYNLDAAVISSNSEYMYAGSSLMATIQGLMTTYHHPDHLSVRHDTDASGNVVGQQGHHPFGESRYAKGATTRWQFTGYAYAEWALNCLF